MSALIPDTGREYISDQITLDEFAIGTGTTDPTSSDTSLENEVYRASASDTNCEFEDTSEDGEIVAKLTVSGGTEVPAGTTITEFGLLGDSGSTLVYREVKSGTTVQSGARITFALELDVVTASA